jgi:DNA-binding Lrp family transcriptional regulator
MAEAYLLINTEIGSENEVLKNLGSISEVKEAYMVYGVYDILAHVETETMEELNIVISRRIRRMEKVRSTITMIVTQ